MGLMTEEPSERPTFEHGSAPLANRGARWTREEEEELVAEVRAALDLTVIAERHCRTRGGVRKRLTLMIPNEENVPDDEKPSWIVAKLKGDPEYDWQTSLDEWAQRVYSARGKGKEARRAERQAHSIRELEPEAVLATWQQIHGRVLGEPSRTRFLALDAIDDLTAFRIEVLAEAGERVYRERGELRLEPWAAECAVPGMTGLLDGADHMRAALARIGETGRALVAALAEAVPYREDREILLRCLGLHGGEPEAVRQISTDLGQGPDQVRERREQAVRSITCVHPRPGHRTARDQAWQQLTLLVASADGAVNVSLVKAVAELSFPEAETAFVKRLITRVMECHEPDGIDASAT
jgi:hypothetical protein